MKIKFSNTNKEYGEVEEKFAQLCMSEINSPEEIMSYVSQHKSLRISALSEYKDNGFVQAAFKGKSTVIEQLLDLFTIAQEVLDISLILACQSGASLTIINKLIVARANVNANYFDDFPQPLVQAVTLYTKDPKKATPIIQELVKQGAKLELGWLGDERKTASLAMQYKSIDIKQILSSSELAGKIDIQTSPVGNLKHQSSQKGGEFIIMNDSYTGDINCDTLSLYSPTKIKGNISANHIHIDKEVFTEFTQHVMEGGVSFIGNNGNTIEIIGSCDCTDVHLV